LGRKRRWIGRGEEEDEYKYVYPSTDKYRMNIGKGIEKDRLEDEEEQKNRR
jgi:hypothetical protein